MSKITLIATATFGLEAVVAKEVRELGYKDLMVEDARVTFAGDEAAVCRANLWLRAADRVLLKMGEFQALTFDELFEKTKALPWPDWIPEHAAFPVNGKSVKSQLHSVPDCQAIVKKAIVEKMKQRYKKDWFPETGPRYTIEVALLKDMATLTIDTSGVGLHKRGYRKLGSQAPLKETLAAAMVLLSRWHPEQTLIDPFCGSGTIPIEAALIGMKMAPGLHRSFAAEKWPVIPRVLWHKAREEAKELAYYTQPLHIIGSDIDGAVLSLARYHARQAGVVEKVFFQKIPVAGIRSRHKYGYIICNPPYGERLGDLKQVEKLYREMGKAFQSLDTWSYYILAAHPGFERLFGRKSDRKRKLYNGRLQCNYYQYYGPRPPRRREPFENTTL
ncbi:MAG: class I SAM-dependent RNA methyltransferase [Desulfotomaculaceae bacterium]|nr:class I SAM-dependent RNA methyltransferase [Desulfotomaculaceae bacterium]MDD4766816.1 class I SAM-dependent RNA methyltransferase [Desulfotomaculaceae bacterium]